VLPAHEPQILLVEREVPDKVSLVDRLGKALQPLDLGVGEEPSRHRRGRLVVDLQVLDREQSIYVRRQAVTAGGLQPTVPCESRPRSPGRRPGLAAIQLDSALVSAVWAALRAEASGHGELDFAVGQNVRPEQRGQAAEILGGEHAGPFGFGEDVGTGRFWT
jgi:hypothetical protein